MKFHSSTLKLKSRMACINGNFTRREYQNVQHCTVDCVISPKGSTFSPSELRQIRLLGIIFPKLDVVFIIAMYKLNEKDFKKTIRFCNFGSLRNLRSLSYRNLESKYRMACIHGNSALREYQNVQHNTTEWTKCVTSPKLQDPTLSTGEFLLGVAFPKLDLVFIKAMYKLNGKDFKKTIQFCSFGSLRNLESKSKSRNCSSTCVKI